MSREIKFRAWAIKAKTMHPVWMKLDDEEGRYILMQYTGLKDRDGKEIYEGDILKGEGEVVWFELSASFRVNPSRENNDICFTNSFANIDDCEIIGNVYENPELLEGDTKT